ANLRVHAVRGDDEVRFGKVRVGFHFALEDELDAEVLAARLQDVEEPAAADADEAMAGGAHPPTLDDDLDIVPVVEGALDLGRGLRIAAAHVLHGGVGEDDAPAEGVVRPVALHDPDLVIRVHLLHQRSEVEAGRPAADADDPHGSYRSDRYFKFKAYADSRVNPSRGRRIFAMDRARGTPRGRARSRRKAWTDGSG